MLHPLGCDRVEGMTRERKSAAAPILVVLAILLLLICGYWGAYLGIGTYRHGGMVGTVAITNRYYRHECAPYVFAPAAWMESKMRGTDVHVLYSRRRVLPEAN